MLFHENYGSRMFLKQEESDYQGNTTIVYNAKGDTVFSIIRNKENAMHLSALTTGGVQSTLYMQWYNVLKGISHGTIR